MSIGCCIVFGFNDTWVILCRLPEEREKRDRRGDERDGQRRKREMKESKGTEEITTFPFYHYLLQGQQALPNCKSISVGCPGDKSYMTPSPHPTTPGRMTIENVLLSISKKIM